MIFFKIFLEICLFRSGPQHLPASNFFLGMVLAANAIVGLTILSIEASVLVAVPQFLVGIALLVFFSWLILAMSGKLGRYQQTLTALLGADTLISFLVLPCLFWISSNREYGVAYFVLVGSVFWSIAVFGHVIRHALSSSYLFGLGLAVLYYIASSITVVYLFPANG